MIGVQLRQEDSSEFGADGIYNHDPELGQIYINSPISTLNELMNDAIPKITKDMVGEVFEIGLEITGFMNFYNIVVKEA